MNIKSEKNQPANLKNGHTYFVADVKGATITPKKLSSAKSFPRKANYRTTLAVTNKDFSLFDDAPEFQNPEFVYDPRSLSVFTFNLWWISTTA
ncbi:hypothetical protein [Lactococcus garvieae]|uniref:hypothetical protein n=1 Tax=Lactococcus garvieae TaxID=1363 RepID=UPI001ED8DF2F|nr:hypothetical protein [Lactococcus garvieae]